MNMPWKINDLPTVRVRHDPPTIEEALYAAEGLTDNVDHQVALAAELMGAPEDEVRKHVKPAGSVKRSDADRSDRFERVERVERYYEPARHQAHALNRSAPDRAVVVVERKSARPQMRLGPSLPSGVVRLNRIR
jgi:hypothetical protein